MSSTNLCLSRNLSPTSFGGQNSRKRYGYAAHITTTSTQPASSPGFGLMITTAGYAAHITTTSTRPASSPGFGLMITTAKFAKRTLSPHFTEEKTEAKTGLGTRTQISLNHFSLPL